MSINVLTPKSHAAHDSGGGPSSSSPSTQPSHPSTIASPSSTSFFRRLSTIMTTNHSHAASGSTSTSSFSSSSSKSSSSKGRFSSFGQTRTRDFLYLYQDSDCIQRIFWNTIPIACLVLLCERYLFDFPLVVDLLICLALSFLLSFLRLFTSRLASVVTLFAGSLVVNLNTERCPRLVLYDAHHHAGCRVLRQTLSGLGLEVEIKSIPVQPEGAQSQLELPWRQELESLIKTQRRTLSHASNAPSSSSSSLTPLPYLSGLENILPSLASKQGDGPAMARELLQHFALDPKECFPLDLSPKVSLKLAACASFLRSFIPWGVYARPINWHRLNRIRRQANGHSGASSRRSSINRGSSPNNVTATAAAALPPLSPMTPSRPSTDRVTNVTSAREDSPSSNKSHHGTNATPSTPSSGMIMTPPMSPVSTAKVSPSTSIDAPLTASPLSSHVMPPSPLTSPSSSSASSSSSLGADPLLKIRAQLQRQALARVGTNGSNHSSGIKSGTKGATHFMIEEELTDIYTHADLQPLTIYGTESNANCRPLFELCCSLQLPYILFTSAQGSMHRAKLVLEYGEKWKLPTIVDPNTRRVVVGTPTCVEYILETYTDEPE